MRIGTIALVLAAVVFAVIVLEHQWQTVPDAPSMAASSVVEAERPLIPAARQIYGLERPSEVPGPLPDRSNTDTRPIAMGQSEPPTVLPSVPGPSLGDASGTPDSPGDPLTQPEETSEQFMHSRRGDGQHSE